MNKTLTPRCSSSITATDEEGLSKEWFSGLKGLSYPGLDSGIGMAQTELRVQLRPDSPVALWLVIFLTDCSTILILRFYLMLVLLADLEALHYEHHSAHK